MTLPLLRDMPKNPDSSSGTPKSVTSLPRETDETIPTLRTRIVGSKVSLCGFDIETPDPVVHRMGKLLKASVSNFLTNWYGLQIVPLGQKASIIIANEADPALIAKLIRQGTTNRKLPTILVLCSHSSRFDRTLSETESNKNVGFVAKPVGPLKLARALNQCLDGTPPLPTPKLLDPSSAESNDLSNVFEEMNLTPHGGEVLDNSRMAADSDNARKAIESPTPNASNDKGDEFPFPVEDRPTVPKFRSMPGDKETLEPLRGEEIPSASVLLSDMEKSSTNELSPSKRQLSSPRLLLVDDNKINLTLLRTYMRKRKYDIVDEAENGLDAVNKFREMTEGYDIIFMDISMPVLDGFGATRQIRAIEASRRQKTFDINRPADEPGEAGKKATEKGKSPALVIALTGLASSRDQSEAFTSGIDLFLTKPVAFKEVGKMLDNWEANRERDERSSEGSS